MCVDTRTHARSLDIILSMYVPFRRTCSLATIVCVPYLLACARLRVGVSEMSAFNFNGERS